MTLEIDPRQSFPIQKVELPNSSQVELSSDEFTNQTVAILNEGVNQHHCKEHMTDRLFKLFHDNPGTAESFGWPRDHLSIKKEIVTPWYKDHGVKPEQATKNAGGVYEIIVEDKGGRNGPTYGGKMIVRSGDGSKAIEVPVSTWPNPKNPSPGIKEGTYQSVYRNNGHKQQTKPGVRLKDGGKIPTLGPNSAQDNQPYAELINLHCGYTEESRGSEGCITIQPDYCEAVWDVLDHESKGPVTVNRE